MTDISAVFEKFNSLNILIIGDVMMDTYLWGKVERISPEAPVPIVSVIKKENRLGGAANVALNVQSLGANPILCAVIGNDIDGETFLELLKTQKLSATGIIKVDNRPTTVKTRVIGGNQQIVRLDTETEKVISDETTRTLQTKIIEIIETTSIQAIIFEDYDKGLISENLITAVVDYANSKNILTIVDPKKKNFLSYKNVTLFKPNLKELREGIKQDVDARNNTELTAAVTHLQNLISAKMVMVTLSELGIYLSSGSNNQIIPAHIRDIADVSGAGDTVIATTALCLAAGLNEFKTAAIANLAGGLVCEQVGVVSINKASLLAEIKKL
jgi:rfaE bifunctional protein kinase chain/domain